MKKALHRILGDGIRHQGQTYVRGIMSSRKHHPRFVIFSRGRSGSSLLVDLLNGLPEVHCDGEVLHNRVLAPRLYVRCRESLAPGQAYGFKLLTYQLPTIQRISDGAAFLRHLDGSGYRIVYLERSNLVRQVLSNLYAHHRKQYQHRIADGEPEVTPMTVDLGQLHRWLRSSERRARYERAALSGLDFLDVVYERDLQEPDDHQRTVDRVADYLGVATAPARAGLARQMSADLSDFISNHEEVVEFVEGTRYRRYLDSEASVATWL